MFIGHYAVGFASKRFAPKASLGTLLLAPLFLDVLWPIFLVLGWESVRIDPGNTPFTPLAFDSYPISHSLATAIAWSIVFAIVYWWATRYRAGTIAVALGVLSHWLLDAATHRPDLPLYPGGPKVGLGLWYSVPGTVAVETSMLAVGVWLYLSATRSRDRIGSMGLVLFLVTTMAMYIAAAFGPPPPSVTVLELSAIGLWLMLLWAWWVDRHREAAMPRR